MLLPTVGTLFATTKDNSANNDYWFDQQVYLSSVNHSSEKYLDVSAPLLANS